jgi:hypothetical protein
MFPIHLSVLYARRSSDYDAHAGGEEAPGRLRRQEELVKARRTATPDHVPTTTYRHHIRGGFLLPATWHVAGSNEERVMLYA